MGSLPPAAGGLPIPAIRAIAVDAKTPQRVYAVGPAGLFRSDDAGLNWIESGKGLSDKPLAVTTDPANPQTVFAFLSNGSLWRSNDGATSWQKVDGGK